MYHAVRALFPYARAVQEINSKNFLAPCSFSNSPSLMLNLQQNTLLKRQECQHLRYWRTVKQPTGERQSGYRPPSWIIWEKYKLVCGAKMVSNSVHVLALKCDIWARKMEDLLFGWVSCYGIKTSLCHWTRTIKRVKTMGLLTILKKMKQKEKEMRILMLYP